MDANPAFHGVGPWRDLARDNDQRGNCVQKASYLHHLDLRVPGLTVDGTSFENAVKSVDVRRQSATMANLKPRSLLPMPYGEDGTGKSRGGKATERSWIA